MRAPLIVPGHFSWEMAPSTKTSPIRFALRLQPVQTPFLASITILILWTLFNRFSRTDASLTHFLNFFLPDEIPRSRFNCTHTNDCILTNWDTPVCANNRETHQRVGNILRMESSDGIATGVCQYWQV